MITPSSNKSPFKTYFLYRLRSQSKILIVSLMLNILALPIFSIHTLISYKSQFEMMISEGSSYRFNLRMAMDGLEIISALAVFAIAFLGAISPFDYCLKSERTDTVGGLPVTLKGRFWADFLSGYISRVAPIIPCSVFSMIMSVSINDWLNKIAGADQGGIMIKAFLELNIAFFISCTFAYVLSVLITVCCGKISSSVAFTGVSSIGLIVLSVIFNGFMGLCQIGSGILGNSLDIIGSIPPLGMFLHKVKGAYDVINNISDIGNNRLPGPEDMTFTEPAAYLIYGLVIAAFITAAYFAFKFRKPENTGHAVAVRKFYYAFAGVCAFTLICLCCMILYRLHMWWLTALVSFAAAIIMLMIFALVRSRKKSELSKDFVRGVVVIVCCLAFLFVFDKTGAFGTRYYNVSPEKTESIDIGFRDPHSISRSFESFTLTDKDDIRKFIESINKTLKNRSDELEYGYDFRITYNLSNQKSIYRDFSNNEMVQSGEEISAVKEMIENVRSLPNYPRYSSEAAAERISHGEGISIVMYDKFGEITIPQEHIGKFKEILSNEIIEKYDKNAKEAGRVIVRYNDNGYSEFPIYSSCTDAIGFAESLRVYDGDAVAFTIISYHDIPMTVNVKVKDVDNAEEKELFSLFEQKPIYYDSGFTITADNRLSYIVPEENKERVLELMMTIIEKQFTQPSQ